MLRRGPSACGERGASMLIALGLTVAVLGFGAVALRIATDDLSASDRMVDRSRAELLAELGASEAVGLILDGATSDLSGSGVVDGVSYSYSAVLEQDASWTVTGSAGSPPDQRLVTVTLGGGGATDPPNDAFAFWANVIEADDDSTGTINAPIGAAVDIQFEDSAFGTAQYLLPGAACQGCDNSMPLDSHTATPLPSAAGAQPCPYTSGHEIKNSTIAAGTYSCTAVHLHLKGAISVSGPVVLYLGPNTELDMKNTQVNVGGSADNLIIAQAPAGKDTKAKIERSTFVGQILMPSAKLEMKKMVTWTGLIEVDELKLKHARVDGTPISSWDTPTTSSAEGYALWANEIKSSDKATGTVDGWVGGATEIDFSDSSFGSEQHVLPGATCDGCSNPILITSHTATALPSAAGALPCPYTSGHEIKNSTIAAGTYLCTAVHLHLKGRILVSGPVVLHLGPTTELDVKDARVNVGGSSDDLVIVQVPAGQSGKGKLEKSTFVGQILMPSAEVELKKRVTWVGLIEADELKLDKVRLNGAADAVGTGSGGSGGSGDWQITGWDPS